jgi:predicted phage-related endonuclease
VSVPVLVCHSSDPSWLQERRKGVTASEVPTILHGSALRLWSDKIGMTVAESEYIETRRKEA